MGADMLGYIVVGPRKITEGRIEKAAKALLRKAMSLPENGDWQCGNCGVANIKDDLECLDCGAERVDLAKVDSLTEARAYIRSLVADWPPGFRDVAIRPSPFDEDQVIVFAGEMSWGDEPSGRGYALLKRIVASGVSDELGIL